MCALLVGLPDVVVLGVEDEPDHPLRVWIEQLAPTACPSCGGPLWVKDRCEVEHVDMPCFGRPARLVWRKHRMRCTTRCGQPTWTVADDRIAGARAVMTARAGRWATLQVGCNGRTVAEVARELGTDWHTVNDTVIAYGEAVLGADEARFGEPTAIGMDEMLMVRVGPRRAQQWVTSVVDVRAGRLLDLVEGKDTSRPIEWLRARPAAWCDRITDVTLDLAGTCRKVFTDAVPHAVQVADPFHVVRVANQALDECRRRVQHDTLGHRGRKDEPLYRSRRLLTMAAERLDERGERKLRGLLRAGDPHGEVALAYAAKEVVRQLYTIDDPALAAVWVDEFIADASSRDMPVEVRRLARTVKRWRSQILAWHAARVTNGPTEAMNNLTKRIKRIAFGFRSFRHFRVRALLYAGRPDWSRLDTITPR